MVIVGAGPAGLAAAIRLKQISSEYFRRRGGEGLRGRRPYPLRRGDRSGGLDALLPDWRGEDTPIKTAVTDDRFYLLSPARRDAAAQLLMPPLMSNHGNFIVSLGNVCRWLATKAEALGVEIYPGFAAAEVLFGDRRRGGRRRHRRHGRRQGRHSPRTPSRRGMELRAKYTLFAEGARGQLTKTADRALRPRPTAASRRNSASA